MQMSHWRFDANINANADADALCERAIHCNWYSLLTIDDDYTVAELYLL